MEMPMLGPDSRSKRNWQSVAARGFLAGAATVAAIVCIIAGTQLKTRSPGDAISLLMGEETWCKLKSFRNVAMKTVLDATVFGLVRNINKDQKFEASGVVLENGAFYVICDSSWSIPIFHDLSQSGNFDEIYNPGEKAGHRWSENTAANYLIPPADLEAFPHDVDSQWEAITYNRNAKHHIVVQESVVLDDKKYHAVIMNVDLQHHPVPQWTLKLACRSEFAFRDDSKGFEGMLGMDGVDGRFFLLGLCEGNYCNTGDKGKEHGHGQIVIMELDEGKGKPNTFEGGYFKETSTCMWKTLRKVDIPSVAQFEDYSDIARRGDNVAISSQASSALFFGKMTLAKDGLLDPDTFEITGGQVTRFAPTSACQVQYCNVEGIDFINDRLIVGASDSMKGGGRQDFMCLDKDQSMHVFVLPNQVEL